MSITLTTGHSIKVLVLELSTPIEVYFANSFNIYVINEF